MAVGQGYAAAARSRLGTIGEAKAAFFNPNAILKGMDRAAARGLSKFGAFVRQSAKTSIRYRKDPSAPGQPPSAHRTVTRTKTNRKTGATKAQASSPLRDLIFFYYDRDKKSVIIGPVIFPSARRKGTPERLEKGGSVAGFKRQPVAGRPGRRGKLVRATLHYPARPFMSPAFNKELPKLVGFFRNAI